MEQKIFLGHQIYESWAKEQVQREGIENIFNKIIIKYFPNCGNELITRHRRVLEHQIDNTMKEPLYIIL
jgi:hypothetical protein